MIAKSHVAMLIAATFLTGAPVFAQGTAPAADNTKSNKMDPSNRVATADDQKNDPSDLKLTQQIRKSVVADKSLSTYAHNVKIVAVRGNVTLSGVVRSQAEKDAVGAKAQAVVQHGSLTNDITISPETKRRRAVGSWAPRSATASIYLFDDSFAFFAFMIEVRPGQTTSRTEPENLAWFAPPTANPAVVTVLGNSVFQQADAAGNSGEQCHAHN